MHLDRAIEKLRTALPLDLPSGLPIYVVSKFQAGLGFHARPGCLAWTSALLDLQLKPMLQADGRWFGRGFAVILNDVFPMYYDDDGAQLFATLLHEVSHRHCVSPNFLCLPWETLPAPWQELIVVPTVEENEAMEQRDQIEKESRPYRGHDAQWIRSALHTAARAVDRKLLGTIEGVSIRAGASKVCGFQHLEKIGWIEGTVEAFVLGTAFV